MTTIIEDLGPIGIELIIFGLALLFVILLANGGRRCEGVLKYFERVFLLVFTFLLTIIAMYVSWSGGEAIPFWMYALIGLLMTFLLPYAKR